MYVTMPNFVPIGQTIAEIWRLLVFQNDGRPPSWISFAPVWTTHKENVMVFIHCGKFGWDRCSSFDNTQVLIFCKLGLKMPIHATNGRFGGV